MEAGPHEVLVEGLMRLIFMPYDMSAIHTDGSKWHVTTTFSKYFVINFKYLPTSWCIFKCVSKDIPGIQTTLFFIGKSLVLERTNRYHDIYYVKLNVEDCIDIKSKLSPKVSCMIFPHLVPLWHLLRPAMFHYLRYWPSSLQSKNKQIQFLLRGTMGTEYGMECLWDGAYWETKNIYSITGLQNMLPVLSSLSWQSPYGSPFVNNFDSLSQWTNQKLRLDLIY